MYIMKELTNATLVQIGDFFGGRDHSTVLHAIEKVTEELKNNPELKIINKVITSENYGMIVKKGNKDLL